MEIGLEHQQALLHAARTAIRETLRAVAPLMIPLTDDPILSMPAGCFVSLHEQATHRLRGCIGRLQTSDPLIKTIYETAVNCLADPRFRNNPVTLVELTRLSLEISVLSPMRPAAHPLDFDPPNHGIYLICNGRTGTFLPQVARQTGWTREQLLARLCSEKMGLPPDAWQGAGVRLLKYSALVIGPAPFVQETRPVGPPGSDADGQKRIDSLIH